MRGEGHGGVGGVEGEELGAEFGEVDFLGVGGAVGVCGWWGVLGEGWCCGKGRVGESEGGGEGGGCYPLLAPWCG